MANILIIDDDKDILRLLEFTLKRVGHTVITAKNGEEGLKITRAQKPNLIVCDIMMPKMTGYDFCKHVRADQNIQNIPIIAFSARFQPIDKQTALEAGATDYLSKSTAPNALLARIVELLPHTPPTTKEGVVGVFSLRGGVGVTCLAINLAIALKVTQKSDVALLDMALQGGHAAVMLGLRPTSNVAQIMTTLVGNFSASTVKPHFINHSSGVALLASAPAFVEDTPFSGHNLSDLVKSVRAAFSITILDIPHLLETRSVPLLQNLDKVILVLSPDMPSLQSTAIALQGFNKLGLSNNNILLAVNQTTPRHALSLEIIQKALKRPIQATIPFEADMTKAVNSGKPLLLSNPRSPVAAAIGKLANSILS